MRPGRFLLLAAFLLALLGQAWSVEPTVSFNGWTNTPGVKEGTVNVHDINATTPRPTMGYVDYLPLGYDPNDHTKRWPVVFALLGIGEEGNGTNTGNQLYLNMTKHGPLFDVETLHYDFPCIIITPQSPGAWNNATPIKAMVDYVKANYRVDTTRIYMTGLCDGCSGTLRFATAFPGILAGIIPITASYLPGLNPATRQSELDALKNVPMWMAQCFADDDIPRTSSIAWCNQVTQNDTGMASDLMASYPGYGGNSHYACLVGTDGKPANANGLSYNLSGATATNGSPNVSLPQGNFVQSNGSFISSLWGSGSDAQPFATVSFGSDPTSNVIQGFTNGNLTMVLNHPYAGTTQTATATVRTPVGLVETAYYNPSNGTWTWPAVATTTTGAPPAQEPPAPGTYDKRVFTMFWQQNHTTGWVETWKNGKVWDWLFTRAPNTTPATVTLGGLSTTYTGAGQAATVTTNPSGLAVTVTYDGSSSLPVTAGSHAVVATVNDPVYSGTASNTMTIAQAAVGVTLSNLTTTWDGSAKPVGVTTNPAGVAVSVSYAGGGVPVEPGSYAVVATSSDPNYTGSASGTLTIAKAAGSVALGQLSFTFDGSAKPISPTTTPTGLAVTTTYAGSASAPSAVGTYAVASTISDAHYQGAASGTLTIATATATVTLSGLSATFDGSPHAVTATTNPPGLSTSITYDGSATAPTAAGSHAVVATVTDPSHSGSVSGTLVIAPASATVTIADQHQTYDGTGRVATFTTTPTGIATSVTYNGAAVVPVNAGTYNVSVTISDTNYTGSGTAHLVVDPAPASVALSGLSLTYNGGPRAAVVTTTPAGLANSVTYNGSAALPQTVGSYSVAASVTDPNYTGSATGTLTIAPAPVTIVVGGLSTTYDGNGHTAVVSTSPSDVATTVTYDGGSAVPVNVGSYAVAVQIADPNFSGTPTSDTLTIAQASAAVSFTDLNSAFDGQPHGVTVVTTPAGLATTVTYDGSASPPSAIGNHAVVATVTDPNYVGTGSATETIATSPSTITLSGLSATYDGTPKSVAATTSPAGLTVDITYNGSTTPPTEAGSYAVNATVSDPDHPGSASGTLVIAKALAVVSLGSLTATYDGTAKAATASVTPTGLAVGVTYNGAATAPTAAGSYSVVATVDTADYSGSASGTLVIAKAPLIVAGNALTAVAGAGIPPLTFHFIGLLPVDGDGSSVLLGTPTLITTATSSSLAGSYPLTVTLSGVSATNYALTAQAGTVVLTPDGSGSGGGGGGGSSSGSGGGGGCGHGTAFAALMMFGLMLMGYLRLMVARPDGRRD